MLGVRAFGTQLLCEQVVGRALRRQSYEPDGDGRFPVEYADVLGIPFDFTATPVATPPRPPRETVHVKAVRPERDPLEIRFPRVAGYGVELPADRLSAEFNEDSMLELTPELVGATETRNSGIIGESVDLDLAHAGGVRTSQVVYELTAYLLSAKFRDANGEPRLYLFGQLKRIVRRWLDACLVCKGGTRVSQVTYKTIADLACRRLADSITRSRLRGGNPVKVVLDPYNPGGSTARVNFHTSKTSRYETDAGRCHVNWAILDSDWEAELCRVVERHPQVVAWVKNHNLGFEVPYPHRRAAPNLPPRLHRAARRRTRGRRPPAPGHRGQGLPGGGRQGQEGGDGDLLGAGGEPPRRLRPLGLRRAPGRVHDAGRPRSGERHPGRVRRRGRAVPAGGAGGGGPEAPGRRYAERPSARIPEGCAVPVIHVADRCSGTIDRIPPSDCTLVMPRSGQSRELQGRKQPKMTA